MERVTDQERREVVSRLREIRPCKSGHIKWWEIARALGLKQPAGWFGWEKFEPDSVNRLADLISQDNKSIEFDAFRPVESDGSDRGALLALANEMKATAKEAESIGFVFNWRLYDFARRIRKLLEDE